MGTGVVQAGLMGAVVQGACEVGAQQETNWHTWMQRVVSQEVRAIE